MDYKTTSFCQAWKDYDGKEVARRVVDMGPQANHCLNGHKNTVTVNTANCTDEPWIMGI